MFSSLPAFYNSQAWRSFRQQVIADRSEADGYVRDEVTGEVLLHPYDIILHHKIPLTMGNVNDVAISLNPDNIQIVSHASHNELHNRFGLYQPKRVYLVYGSPLSGKTSWALKNKGSNDLLLDIDMIWQCITGADLYIKPDALKQNVFLLRDAMLDQIKTRTGKWQNAYVVSSSARKGDRERMLTMLQAEEVFIDTSRKECLRRLYADNSRTTVVKEWEGFIDKWFKEFQS